MYSATVHAGRRTDIAAGGTQANADQTRGEDWDEIDALVTFTKQRLGNCK
jgi:hypothetical protein